MMMMLEMETGLGNLQMFILNYSVMLNLLFSGVLCKIIDFIDVTRAKLVVLNK